MERGVSSSKLVLVLKGCTIGDLYTLLVLLTEEGKDRPGYLRARRNLRSARRHATIIKVRRVSVARLNHAAPRA